MLLSLNYRDATLDASKIPEIFSKESMHPHRVQEKNRRSTNHQLEGFLFFPCQKFHICSLLFISKRFQAGGHY